MDGLVPEELIARIAASAAKEALRHVHQLSKDEASNIALAAAKEAVRETHAELFALLGYNIADFRDIKRLRGDLDFLGSLHSNRQLGGDLEFLGALHSNAAKAGARVMFGVISIVVGSFAVALWIGFKALVVAR